MRTLVERISTYRNNVSTGSLAWNLLLMVLVIYLVSNMRTPTASAMLVAVIAAGLVCGTAVLPFTRTRARAVARAIDIAWWLAVVCFGVNFFGISPQPLVTALAVPFIVMFGLSASFWLLSTPGMMTQHAYQRLMRRAERQENLRRIADGTDRPGPV